MAVLVVLPLMVVVVIAAMPVMAVHVVTLAVHVAARMPVMVADEATIPGPVENLRHIRGRRHDSGGHGQRSRLHGAGRNGEAEASEHHGQCDEPGQATEQRLSHELPLPLWIFANGGIEDSCAVSRKDGRRRVVIPDDIASSTGKKGPGG